MKVYKLLCRTPFGLMSYNYELVFRLCPDCVLSYEPGMETRPIIPGTRIFVFATVAEVREFVAPLNNYPWPTDHTELWEAETDSELIPSKVLDLRFLPALVSDSTLFPKLLSGADTDEASFSCTPVSIPGWWLVSRVHTMASTSKNNVFQTVSHLTLIKKINYLKE